MMQHVVVPPVRRTIVPRWCRQRWYSAPSGTRTLSTEATVLFDRLCFSAFPGVGSSKDGHPRTCHRRWDGSCSSLPHYRLFTTFGHDGSSITDDRMTIPTHPRGNNRRRRMQQWSQTKLATTTETSAMKEILGDIALRLDLQSDILQDLTQQIQRVVSSDNDALNFPYTILLTLETIHKNIHSLQVLHRDTAQTCHRFYEHWPTRQDPTSSSTPSSSSSSSSSSPSLTPLFCHQVGQACKEIYARHALTIETVAEIVIDVRGIIRMLETNKSTIKHTNEPTTSKQQHDMASIQCIVTRFLQSRLMTQLLCDHVVDCMMMVAQSLSGTSGWTRPPKPHGAISMNVNVIDLIQSASIEARHLVETNFIPLADHPQAHAPESPEPPHVTILTKMMEDDNDNDNDDQSSSIMIMATVVRPWLQYTLVELLKNSLAITMERDRRRDECSPYYPIVIHVSETETHVHIDLHDQGGGLRLLPRRGNDDEDDNDRDASLTEEDWFEFATRQDKWDRMDNQQTYAMVSSPIRGLGVGLALSRLHMRQFGGDLMLQDRPATSEWEHGVTATLLLSKNLDTLEAEL